MAEYIIRRARVSDTATVMSLLAQVESLHQKGRPDLFREHATKYNEKELESIFADDERPVFVYEENGAVLGYLFGVFKYVKDNALFLDMKTLYIDDICVDEKFRGRHVGKSLYLYAESFARQSGCQNIVLNVWAFNEKAMAFYKSCGMKTQRVYMETVL